MFLIVLFFQTRSGSFGALRATVQPAGPGSVAARAAAGSAVLARAVAAGAGALPARAGEPRPHAARRC